MADNGIRFVALSADDKETTAELVATHKLTCPAGYGADAETVAAATGAFVNPGAVYGASMANRSWPRRIGPCALPWRGCCGGRCGWVGW